MLGNVGKPSFSTEMLRAFLNGPARRIYLASSSSKQEEFKEIFGPLQEARRLRYPQADCYRFPGGKELLLLAEDVYKRQALGSAVYYTLRARWKPLRLLGRGYVSLMRGTPVLMLLMFLFYVVFARTRVDATVVAVLAFGLNTAAYIAKIIESAVQAVEPGQVMAARTLGFTGAAAFRLVVLPQAVVFARPMLQNLAVTTLQWTSVVGYITITDLTRVTNNIGARSARPWLVLGAGISLYFLLAELIGLIFRLTEPKRRWFE